MERCIIEIYLLLSEFNWPSGYRVSFRTGRYPGLCSYSVSAIVCNARFLEVRPMVTSGLALTCRKLASHLHTCRDKFAESLQICSASLLQTKIAIWAVYTGFVRANSIHGQMSFRCCGLEVWRGDAVSGSILICHNSMHELGQSC
ncbi:hypothetical protein AVEN_190612-1 [Araneus ventricosus]|uniref:Uncharacterized protein n=1 Tax=Araneus ventricosus TaxID=182803 RepID=A0A4Y2CE99_ARAVE|nr:hypothetical protein AVEN_190612-1 [Araneus ventricosus]